MEDKNIDKNLNIEDMGEDNNHERIYLPGYFSQK